MASLEIPCPRCGAKLRIPDRSLLGRKGKCGKCGEKFILQEPDEVDFELAPAESETPVGVQARWIDERGPRSGAPAQAPASPVTPASPFGDVEAESPSLQRLRRKPGSRAYYQWGALGCAILALVGGLIYALNRGPVTPPHHAKHRPKPTVEVQPKPEEVAVAEPEVAPRGQPIDLTLVPPASRIVIHLRPAELWRNGGLTEEVRACLGPVAIWAGDFIKQNCFFEPKDVEQLTVCLIPERAGTPPDLAYVVRTRQDFKKSDMLDRFAGQVMDDLGHPHYLNQVTQRVYLIKDQRTFASAPAGLREELVRAVDAQLATADGIEEILKQTDRDRQFTLVFEPISVRTDARFLGTEALQPLLHAVLDWVGEDVDSVAWSLRLGDEFDSELFFRNKTGSPPKLQRVLKKQLDSLPQEILQIVRKMHPAELGRKKVVGRYPAMIKVAASKTRFSTGNRLVQLRTLLPERAAPNLALATLLAWDQTNRPDFGQTPSAPAAAPTKELTMAERLKKKVDVDFRNEPLYQAIDFVGDEIGVKFKIEGNDLKMVGVTQNMKQAFKLDGAPASTVLWTIFNMPKPLGLVIVVDEEKKMITITSEKAAADRGWKAFPLPAPQGK